MTPWFCEEHCILFLNHLPFLTKILSYFFFTGSSPLFSHCFNHRCLSDEKAICANITSKQTTVFFTRLWSLKKSFSVFTVFFFLLYSHELKKNKLFFSLSSTQGENLRRKSTPTFLPFSRMSGFHEQLGPFKEYSPCKSVCLSEF